MKFDPERHCPVCGAANHCEVAEGRGNCWCFATRVDATLLELLEELGIEDRCLCANCASGRVPSPCTDACQLDATGGYCTGCGRTIADIGAWSGMTPVQRAGVLIRLRERERTVGGCNC